MQAWFTIPFNEPNCHDGNSPLVDIGSLPDRLQSEMSVSCSSSDHAHISSTPPQSPADAPVATKSQSGARSHSQLSNEVPVPSTLTDFVVNIGAHSGDLEILPISAREKIHILVVEDK